MSNRTKEILDTFQTIRTYTGKYFNVFSPDPNLIDLEDIAHALSLSCRWGGHCPQFYSVAEHSVRVMELVESMGNTHPSILRAALLHDAAEAYLVDLPSPIKKELPQFKELEDQLLEVICKKYGAAWPLPKEVLDADRQMLEVEWRWICGDGVEFNPISGYMGMQWKIEADEIGIYENMQEASKVEPAKAGGAS